MGRPSDYTPDIAERICVSLVEGEGLRAICRREGMPDRRTVMRWADADPEFAAAIARAREVQQDVIVEEIIELADQATPEDWQVRKLQIHTRQWHAAKLAPKKYADRSHVDVDAKVAVEARPDFSALSPAERDTLKLLLQVAEERKTEVGAGDSEP